MLLSACLIVRDEELTLARCLESLVGIADEIIVVDTGSVDGTREIAKKYTSKVFDYVWNNDFAEARNASLRYASGEYVLVLDADEYLDNSKKWTLRNTLIKSSADGFLVNIQNYVDDNGRIVGTRPVMVLRIFRRGYFYQGSVHEQIAESIARSGNSIEKVDLDIHHLGYLRQIVQFKNKSRRNVQLIKSELRKNPEDLYQLSNLVAEYVRLCDFEGALTIVEKSIALIQTMSPEKWDHIVARVFVFHVACLDGLGRVDEAILVARRYSEIYPELADFRTRLGMLHIRSGRPSAAIAPLMKARDLGEPSEALFDLVRGMGTYLPSMFLGRAWSILGDVDNVRKFFFMSFLENTNQDTLILQLLELLPKDSSFLRREIEGRISDAQTLSNYAEAYALLKMPDAEEVIQRIEDKVGPNMVLSRARFAVLSVETYTTGQDVHIDTSNYELANVIMSVERGTVPRISCAENLDQRTQTFLLACDGDWEGSCIAPYLRDLVCCHADNILRQWLPKAPDREEAWLYLKYKSQIIDLSNVPWEGTTFWECEHLAQHAFQSCDYKAAGKWLAKSMELGELTVTRILLECDLALARADRDLAVSLLLTGAHYFPDSLMISQVRKMWGVDESNSQAYSITSFIPNPGRGTAFMRPSDVYLQNSVRSMPFHVQLASLHERGETLTKHIFSSYRENKVESLRRSIEELENLITFIRGSLNPNVEGSKEADLAYAYFYKVAVRWFLQPPTIEDDYQAMLSFWKSWADTWRRVGSGA